MRKLRLQKLRLQKDLLPVAGGVVVATIWEDVVIPGVLTAIADQPLAVQVPVQIGLGWIPILGPAYWMARGRNAHYYSALGGATVCSRFNNLGIALGLKAIAPVAGLRRGERLEDYVTAAGFRIR